MESNIQEAVIAGGGKYQGIQRGSRQRGIPDMVLFNDPLTGTTLALIVNGGRPITAQRIRAKIASSRATFARYGALDLHANGIGADVQAAGTSRSNSYSSGEVECMPQETA